MTDEDLRLLEPAQVRFRVRPWMIAAIAASTLAGAVLAGALASRLAPVSVASVDLLILPTGQGSIDEAVVRTFESLIEADAFAAEILKESSSETVESLTVDEISAAVDTARGPASALLRVDVRRADETEAFAIAQEISPTVEALIAANASESISDQLFRQVFDEPLVQQERPLPLTLAALIGGFLGGVLAVAVVVGWGVRRPVVQEVGEIRELSGYPVVARLSGPPSWWRRDRHNTVDTLVAAAQQINELGVLELGGVVAVVPVRSGGAEGRAFAQELVRSMQDLTKLPLYLVDGDLVHGSLSTSMGSAGPMGWDTIGSGHVGAPAAFELGSEFPVLAEFGAAPPVRLVPVAEPTTYSTERVTKLTATLEQLRVDGVAVVVCATAPGDVPIAPAVQAADAVLLVVPTGSATADDIQTLGELTASLSPARGGVVVVDG